MLESMMKMKLGQGSPSYLQLRYFHRLYLHLLIWTAKATKSNYDFTMALAKKFLQSWLWVLPILNWVIPSNTQWVWFCPENGFLLTPAQLYKVFLTGMKTTFRRTCICASIFKSGDWAKTPIFQWSNSTSTASVCTCGGQVLKNLTMEAEQGPGVQPGLPQVRSAHFYWPVLSSK